MRKIFRSQTSFTSAAIILTSFSLAVTGETASPDGLCRIEVVEKGSGWPVPLVELRTTHLVRFFADNTGVIAFDLPELMGRETWFDVIGNSSRATGITG